MLTLRAADLAKRYEEGLEFCNEQLSKVSGWPNYEMVFYHCRAVLHTKMSRHNEAGEDIKRVIAINPKYYTESQLEEYDA